MHQNDRSGKVRRQVQWSSLRFLRSRFESHVLQDSPSRRAADRNGRVRPGGQLAGRPPSGAAGSAASIMRRTRPGAPCTSSGISAASGRLRQ